MSYDVTVAAVGDSHFRDTVAGRFGECNAVHDDIAHQLYELKPDILTHTGDVYDQLSTPAERGAVAAWTQKCAEVCPVIFTKGNHDALGDLPLLRRLKSKHPIIVEEAAGTHIVALSGDRHIAVNAVAWPRKAAMLARLGSVSHEDTNAAAAGALEAVLRGFSVEQHPPMPRIVAMHAMVRDSLTSVGQPLVGCDMEIGLEALLLANADAYLLGHIHLPQDWVMRSNGRGVSLIYTGSPRRTAYGEVENKSFTWVKLTPDGDRWKANWKRVPTAAQRMFLVEDTFDFNGGETPGWGTRKGLPEDPNDLTGADVRFRYLSPWELREPAKEAAALEKLNLLAAGAERVTPEPQVDPPIASVASGISEAKTPRDKLQVWWLTQDYDPGPRTDPIMVKLDQVEKEVGRDGSARAAMGPIHKLWLENIGPFACAELSVIDLAGLIWTFRGDNGEGKTMFLESTIEGSIHRKTPSRGPLKKLVTGKKGSTGMTIEIDDQLVELTQTVGGGKSKTGTAQVTVAGVPILEKAGRNEYDNWAAKNIPPASVTTTTLFLPQKREGFIGLDPTPRKDVVMRVLGHDWIDQLSKAAGKHGDTATTKLNQYHARIDELTKGAPDIDSLRLQLAGATASLREAETTLAGARAQLQARGDALSQAKQHAELHRLWKATLDQITKARDDLELQAKRLQERRATAVGQPGRLRLQLAGAAASLREAETTLAGARAQLQARGDALSQAKQHAELHRLWKATLDQITKARDDLELQAKRLQERRATAVGVVRSGRTSLATEATRKEITETVAPIDKATTELDQQIKVEQERWVAEKAVVDGLKETVGGLSRRVAAGLPPTGTVGDVTVKSLVAARQAFLDEKRQAEKSKNVSAAEVDRLGKELESLEKEIRNTTEVSLTGAVHRTTQLRRGITTVANEVDATNRQGLAGKILAEDDEQAVAIDTAPNHLASLRARREDLTRQQQHAAEIVKTFIEQTSPQLSRKVGAIAALEPIVQDLATARESLTASEGRLHELTKRGKALRQEHTTKMGESVALWEEIEKLGDPVDVAEITQAEKLVVEIDEQLAELAPRREAAAKDLGAQEEQEPALVDLDAAEKAKADAAQAVETAASEVKRVEGIIATTNAEITQAEKLVVEIDEQLAELAPRREAAAKDLGAQEEQEPAPVDLDAAEKAKTDAAQAVKTASGEVKRVEGIIATTNAEITQAEKLVKRTAELRSSAGETAAEISDWRVLQKGLGREGIQALELANVDPILTMYANELLHKCHGPRWTVRFTSNRDMANNKGTKEGCWVFVYDTKTGKEIEAIDYSGGERALLNEAVTLALTRLGCQNAGMKRPTIVRDEAGAALDEPKSITYMQMMRMAAEMIGASKVLIVTHNKHLHSMADGTIDVADGNLSVAG